MDQARFLHQFFLFSHAERERRFPPGETSWATIASYFSGEELSRRSLTLGSFPTFIEARRMFEAVEREEADLGIRVLSPDSPEFPPALSEHIPPERLPAFLYLRGQPIPGERSSVAVVGTRKPSRLGMDAAANFSAFFTNLGLKVVSGLARGVDSIAHQENLREGTVAVLGSGVGNVYPHENQALAEAILAQGGALVSPFPLYQIPLPQNFPARNELIAALACGTLVVEGAEQSGAAVTGKLALAMGKSVAVLPQDFRHAFGRGAIRLQQAGAVMVADEEEALQSLYAPFGGFERKNRPPLARSLFTLEEFQAALGKDAAETILLLETAILEGRIRRAGAQRYRFVSKKA